MSKIDQKNSSGDKTEISLCDNAKRALDEAEERRKNTTDVVPDKEINGRKGLDPARYGDWEKKGIAVDF